MVKNSQRNAQEYETPETLPIHDAHVAARVATMQ